MPEKVDIRLILNEFREQDRPTLEVGSAALACARFWIEKFSDRAPGRRNGGVLAFKGPSGKTYTFLAYWTKRGVTVVQGADVQEEDVPPPVMSS